MANPKYLNILKQGVEIWNRWREERPDEEIDLSGTELRKAKLNGVNFCQVNLNGANLREAELFNARFAWASLQDADLYRAFLKKVNCYHADFRRANLRRATIQQANLSGMNLQEANLTDVDFRTSILSRADFRQAIITGAKLYATARDDWLIDGILCDYVYWDKKGEQCTPHERNFRPGEFEELYKALPTIEYYFEHGFTPLDPLIMDQVVQAVNQQHPEFELRLDSFHSRGQSHAVFTVIHKDHSEAALQQITASYEARLAALEGKQEQLTALFVQLASNPQPQLISQCQQVVITGRDYFEHINDHARVSTGTQQQVHQKSEEP